MNELDLQIWIRKNCPQIFGILNTKAKEQLPSGLADYIGDGPLSEIRAGQKNLVSIEMAFTILIDKCGRTEVEHKYRRVLSNVKTVSQVRDRLFEIALCATLGEIFQNLKLSPETGKGTYSDCSCKQNGFDIYGEAKRYEDPWPIFKEPDNNSSTIIPNPRSIFKASGEKPETAVRPRSMDLRSKLYDVHRQFPENTVNIIFVFHPSHGESKKYFRQAFFGDSNYFRDKSNLNLEEDGLFLLDEWKNISACCLTILKSDARVGFPFIWKNPHACVELPKCIAIKLRA